MSDSDHKKSALVDNPEALLGAALIAALRQVIREEVKALSTGSGPVLLTAEELAKALKVNKAIVYRWVKAGTIPFFQAGRFVRFNLAEVLQAQRKKTETP